MAKKTDYHLNIFYSPDDECYVADLPDFEYCSAVADTPQEALAELLVAREAWLAAAREADDPTPEPRYRPVG